MQVLADARHDDLAAARERILHQRDRAREGFAQRIARAPKPFDLNVEDLLRSRDLLLSRHGSYFIK